MAAKAGGGGGAIGSVGGGIGAAIGGARGGFGSIGRIGGTGPSLGGPKGGIGIRVGGAEGARVGMISARDMKVAGNVSFGLPAREGPASKSAFRINSPVRISRFDSVSNHAGERSKPGYGGILKPESLRPAQSRGSELFRAPRNGIINPDVFRVGPRPEVKVSNLIPKRPFAEGLRVGVSNRKSRLAATEHASNLPYRSPNKEAQKSSQTQTEFKPVRIDVSDILSKPKNELKIVNPRQKAKTEAGAREQALVVFVTQKLARILGPEQAKVLVKKALETSQSFKLPGLAKKAENTHPRIDVRARGQQLELAKVLGVKPQFDALASTQPNASAETSSAAQTENGGKTEAVIKTSERVKLVLDYKKKLAAKRVEQTNAKNVKKTTEISTKRKYFQFYAQAHQARIDQAQRLYDQKLAENQAQGIDRVSGNQIGSEYALTQSQKSKALDQLGRNFQPDGSDIETKRRLTEAGDLTQEKIYKIIAKHAPTEIVEGNVTTRKSSKEEIAEVFDGLDKAPALIDKLIGGSLSQTVTSAELKLVKEIVEEKAESRSTPIRPTEILPESENAAGQATIQLQESNFTQSPFRSLQEILDGLNLPKAS